MKLLWYFDNKKNCFIGWFKQIVKKEKARFLCLMFEMKKSFIVYYVFSCTLYKREISFIFCDSESSSVELLYYYDGFLVVHYFTI